MQGWRCRGVTLKCGSHIRKEEHLILSMEDLLSRLPCFPEIAIFDIDTYAMSPIVADGCLSQLDRPFPNLRRLMGTGFQAQHLSGLASCPSLRVLQLGDAKKPMDMTHAVIDLILRTPGLNVVHHPFKNIKTPELQAMLAAAQSVRAAASPQCVSLLESGIWTVKSNPHNLGLATWLRDQHGSSTS